MLFEYAFSILVNIFYITIVVVVIVWGHQMHCGISTLLYQVPNKCEEIISLLI